MNNLISIIVPIYNAEHYLPTCIDSILCQSDKQLEIILVNDGSQDHSGEICEDFQKRDNRIKVIHQENRGVSEARNRGIRESTGQYIQFIDSDDTIAPDMCRTLREAINGNDLVICGMKMIRNDKTVFVYQYPKRETVRNKQQLEAIFTELYLTSLLFSPVNKLYRRDHIKEFFPAGVQFGEDFLFNLAYLKEVETISVIPDILYHYLRVNPNSLVSSYHEQKTEAIFRCNRQLLDFCRSQFGENFDQTPLLRRIHQVFVNDYLGNIQNIVYSSLSKQEKRKRIECCFNSEESRQMIISALEHNDLKRMDRKITARWVVQRKTNRLYCFFRWKYRIARCLKRIDR